MVGSTLTTDVPSVALPAVVVLAGTPASVVTPPLVLAAVVVVGATVAPAATTVGSTVSAPVFVENGFE